MITSDDGLEHTLPSPERKNGPSSSRVERSEEQVKAVAKGWRSPTVLGMHASGWLLLICFFLPVARGCNNEVLRPIAMVQVSPSSSWEDIASGVLVVAVYSHGAMVAALLGVVALCRSARLSWRIFQWHFGVTVLVSVLLSLAIASSREAWRDRILGILYIVPPMTAVLFWISLAIGRGDRQLAWARLQHGWTLACFFILHLQCLFVSAWLYGYFVSLFAFGLMVVMVEIAKHRMAHDLWDPSVPVTKPKFTIKKILIWTTLLAVTIAYFQSIDRVVDYFYRQN